MSQRSISRKEFFLVIARAVGRSRVARVLLALGVLALGCGLAYLCWQGWDMIAIVMGILLVLTCLDLAWGMLPISEQRRSQWARQQELAKRFPSYRFRRALWVGVGMLLGRSWEAYNRQRLDPWEFALPAACLIIGIVSGAVWRIRHRDEQST